METNIDSIRGAVQEVGYFVAGQLFKKTQGNNFLVFAGELIEGCM